MRVHRGGLGLAAHDLGNHLACRHLTALDLAAAEKRIKVPEWRDPNLAVLQERGLEHERAYLEHLERQGLSITRLEPEGGKPGKLEDAGKAFERTCAAMRSGADAIAQATLVSGRWLGRADILRRVEGRSALGAWSYEVVDTKLTRSTRGETILQLCLYSDIVGEIQQFAPQRMHVVAPGADFEPEAYRLLDYLAYYRLIRKRLECFVDDGHGGSAGAATYPEPVPHCEICRWWSVCDLRRRQDDHLCLVAGISKLQTRELQSWPVATLTELAAVPLPLERKPSRGAPETYIRVREQARIQLDGRRRKAPVHELLELEAERGLALLPEPSAGDIFFDIEGDPFVADGGLEYLFGYAALEGAGEIRYQSRWALERAEERAMFECFIAALMERWERFPDMHVYHFTPYEPSALKRLMGRHACRGAELDRILRAERMVDLHAVVKQALRASVERYSLKDLEAHFDFKREVALPDASMHRRAIDHALELKRAHTITAENRAIVEAYNRDDCISTLKLRDWLESLRAGVVAGGVAIARPAAESGEPSEQVEERQQRVQELKHALTGDLPPTPAELSEEQRARWLLAQLLDYHTLEDKASWWEYFRLLPLPAEELKEEKDAIAGLRFLRRIGGTTKCPIDRYHFPYQDTDLREGDELHDQAKKTIGAVAAIDIVARTLDIKKREACAAVHPRAVIRLQRVSPKELQGSLMRLANWMAEHRVAAEGPRRAARNLLLAWTPRLDGDSMRRGETEDTASHARRVILSLVGHETNGRFSETHPGQLGRGQALPLHLAIEPPPPTGSAGPFVVPIQGPPGSGKTYAGARMICGLVGAGMKVGVTALSHKVIRNMLEKVIEMASEQDLAVECRHKVNGRSDQESPGIIEITNYDQLRDELRDGTAQVVGGTAWVWARELFFEAVDVLFVDEAGQLPLATVVAAAQGAKSVVLLGDPQQLEQPQQASHPENTDASALEHFLAGRRTLPPDRGLFLPETWRLHPSICSFTSEIFYEGRLSSRAGLERQAIVGPTPLRGAGLWFAPVAHEGNQRSSPEEVERVAGLVESLLADGVGWIDSEGTKHRLTLDDILIVAPYNTQVADLSRRIAGARVGTVDRFQGQETPVVIYSMATSSPEEAPRGMEFLYSLHRLNVATSRARCACVLVASPRLFEPECNTPQQMQLANALCRYLELARTI